MNKLIKGRLHIGRHRGASHIAQDSVQVVEGECNEVPGVVTHEHLILDCHGHQIVQLVHAVAVQLHDGGMCQLIKHRLEHPPAVNWLVLVEYLLDEPPIEHCGHDIVHNLTANHVLIPH